MLVNRKSPNKKNSNVHHSSPSSLGASLTSIDWLTDMQIVKPSSSLPTPPSSSSSSEKLPIVPQTALPITLSIAEVQEKIEPTEIELPTSTVHAKPPCSYVNLIRQAILSAPLQRMTLNEIYQWIVESYPYFRTAPPKWKNSIRHNLSLNKCFRRLQRSTDDPGKGSYWAVVDCASADSSSALTSPANVQRKRKFDEMQTPMNILPTSPESTYSSCTVFSTNKNPMICGDLPVPSDGRPLAIDKSSSTTSFVTNSLLLPPDDLNLDLTSSSLRRIYEPIFDTSMSTWLPTTDISSTSPTRINVWSYETNPSTDQYNFPETVNVSSTGEMHLNDFHAEQQQRRSSMTQQDDRNAFAHLNSSLSSILDWNSINHLSQSKLPNESSTINRYSMTSHRTMSETPNHLNSFAVAVDDDAFDWESII